MLKLLPLAALAAASPAYAQQQPVPADRIASATSPDGQITVTLAIDNEGRPNYWVTKAGKPIIAQSALGFILSDAPKLHRRFAIENRTTLSRDSTWEQPWGEWQNVRDNHVELKVRLKETTALARVMDVTFRIFNDGVGFRYEIPDQPNLKTLNITDELTEFAVAEDGDAWWTPGGEWNRYEYPYNRTPISGVGTAHTPITVRFKDGTHIAFHEASLVDYSAMWMRRVEGTKFRAHLSPAAKGPKVVRNAPFTTPWRTMRIASSAPALYMSQLELNLNEPNKLGDVSWYKPSKYVGVWWELHLEKTTWNRERLGATTANVKRYIDFAAKHGFTGVLVEGWNVGWDSDWFGNGDAFDFATPVPEFDMAELSRYATARGVRIVGHHETGGSASHYEKQAERAYAYARKHNIGTVKSGYVADAGGLRRIGPDGKLMFEWHDGQFASNHHLNIVRTAAKHRVAVNPHEPIKDTGLRRTYPNWVTREGARGQEYNAWGEPFNSVSHDVDIIFTRMLSGPFDYTPGILSLVGRDNRPLNSTLAKQLAHYVTIYSPEQMAADLPENYERYPEAFQFIKDVPADWSDTIVLNGEVGQYATIVRKERGGDGWYLGAVTDQTARRSRVTLDFLDAGRNYTAEIYRDGDDADYRTDKRHSIRIERRTVRKGDTLDLRLAPGGGAAVRMVPTR